MASDPEMVVGLLCHTIRARFGSIDGLCQGEVAILPISEKYNDYAERVQDYLATVGVRAVVDNRNEKIGRKVRDNEIKRIPYMVIVGEKEEADGTVAMRQQGGGEQATLTMQDFGARICAEVADMLQAMNIRPKE